MHVTLRLYYKQDLDLITLAKHPDFELSKFVKMSLIAFVRRDNNFYISPPERPVDLSGKMSNVELHFRLCPVNDADVIDYINNIKKGYRNNVMKIILRSYLRYPFISPFLYSNPYNNFMTEPPKPPKAQKPPSVSNHIQKQPNYNNNKVEIRREYENAPMEQPRNYYPDRANPYSNSVYGNGNQTYSNINPVHNNENARDVMAQAPNNHHIPPSYNQEPYVQPQNGNMNTDMYQRNSHIHEAPYMDTHSSRNNFYPQVGPTHGSINNSYREQYNDMNSFQQQTRPDSNNISYPQGFNERTVPNNSEYENNNFAAENQDDDSDLFEMFGNMISESGGNI